MLSSSYQSSLLFKNMTASGSSGAATHTWHKNLVIRALTPEARYLRLPILECKTRIQKIPSSGPTMSLSSSFSSYACILDWEVSITDPFHAESALSGVV